jgi:hypothetical protein
MHERYLYLGDALAVLYFIVFRKNLFVSVGILSVSFYAYLCCSRLKEILPLWPGFFLYLIVLILVFMNFRKRIQPIDEVGASAKNENKRLTPKKHY